MCVLSTLCGNVEKHSPFDIYIYIYMCVCVCNARKYVVWINFVTTFYAVPSNTENEIKSAHSFEFL